MKEKGKGRREGREKEKRERERAKKGEKRKERKRSTKEMPSSLEMKTHIQLIGRCKGERGLESGFP